MMNLSAALATFCETLRTQLDVPVTLGPPEDTTPGVYVWPWRLEEVASLANQRLPLRPGAHANVSTSSQSIHFLVLTQPANSADGLAWLAQARQTLLAHPVLQVDGGAAQVLLSSLTVEQLTGLFLAARLPLTLCVSGVLRGV